MALVRDYIACIEELSTISKVLASKRAFLQRLLKDCKEIEAENFTNPCRSNDDDVDTIQQEGSMVERCNWALDIIIDQDDLTRSILEDLQGSMQAVCTLSFMFIIEFFPFPDHTNDQSLLFITFYWNGINRECSPPY